MKAQFLRSVLAEEKIPAFRNLHGTILPEIAVIGRSNVGKSSLINHLLQHQYLAKVSSTPGKTQSINFFMVDETYILVDLPGYGFAKVSKDLKEKWGKSIQDYLEKRPQLKLLLLLMDMRRDPTDDDIAFVEWAHFHDKPILCILTKSDKLTTSETQKQTALFQKTFSDLALIPYSIKDSQGRKQLIRKLEDL